MQARMSNPAMITRGGLCRMHPRRLKKAGETNKRLSPDVATRQVAGSVQAAT